MKRQFIHAQGEERCKAMMTWFSAEGKSGKRVTSGDSVQCGRKHVDGTYCLQHKRKAEKAAAKAQEIINKNREETHGN